MVAKWGQEDRGDVDDVKIICQAELPDFVLRSGFDVTIDQNYIRIWVLSSLIKVELVQFYRGTLEELLKPFLENKKLRIESRSERSLSHYE